MEPTLSQVVVGVAIALIVSVVLFGLNVKSSLVRIETILTGADGTNGLNGEVRSLKAWRQDVEEQSIPRRVLEIERRHGLADRREA
jgi:cell division protein FtsL